MKWEQPAIQKLANPAPNNEIDKISSRRLQKFPYSLGRYTNLLPIRHPSPSPRLNTLFSPNLPRSGTSPSLLSQQSWPAMSLPTFDFYVFALSWQPEFCYNNYDSYPGCSAPDPAWSQSLTIHGMWPQVRTRTSLGGARGGGRPIKNTVNGRPFNTFNVPLPRVKQQTVHQRYLASRLQHRIPLSRNPPLCRLGRSVPPLAEREGLCFRLRLRRLLGPRVVQARHLLRVRAGCILQGGA